MLKSFKPTESELEILNILWEKEHATVRDVHEIMKQKKEVGYTTTLKLMQIMHEKELVSRDTSSKKHIYTANFSKLAAQDQYLNKLIKNVFHGDAVGLVAHVMRSYPLVKKDLIEIKQLISDLEK